MLARIFARPIGVRIYGVGAVVLGLEGLTIYDSYL